LDAIEQHYLPRVELEPQLEGRLEKITRGFQDAVAARDSEALEAMRAHKTAFLDDLGAAHGAVDANEAAALRAAFDDYFAAAEDVAERLIAQESGEALVGAIADMQAKQARTKQALQRVTAFDRHELSDAFREAARLTETARTARFWISVAFIVVVAALSYGMSRGVLRSIGALRAGLGRFGAGKFDERIVVTSNDELADVAAGANQMAENLARTQARLQQSNQELEAFSYSVAHDLRAPLRAVNGFSAALLEDYGAELDEDAKSDLRRIIAASERMAELIDALLALARLTRTELRKEKVDLTMMANAVVGQLRATDPERNVDFAIEEGLVTECDSRLVRAALENLLGNAWKFTRKEASAKIELSSERADGATVYVVHDNGAGFDMNLVEKLFAPFRRLHKETDFEGTGVGLATVQRIVRRHGGRIWAESAPGKGATFRFTLAAAAQEG
jgi:signal transduction histidine kinase